MGTCENCEYRDNPVGHCCDEFKIIWWGIDKSRLITYYRKPYYYRFSDSKYKCERLEEEVRRLLIADGRLSEKEYKLKESLYSEIPIAPDEFEKKKDIVGAIERLSISHYREKTQRKLGAEDKKVREAIEKANFTPKQKAAFMTYDLNQKKNELAKTWGVTPSAITKLNKKAIKKVKKAWEGG